MDSFGYHPRGFGVPFPDEIQAQGVIGCYCAVSVGGNSRLRRRQHCRRRGSGERYAAGYVVYSGFHQLTPNWALMADVTRTYWSKLPELGIDFDSSQSGSVVTLALKDVNRFSVGATFTLGGAWVYRAGLALDETPTPNETVRTPRLPDEDRFWIALGAGYKHSETLIFDFSYVHIKVDDASINKSAGTAPAGEDFLRGSLVGAYEAYINILSAQARWTFK